jgi:hypothetical protein
LLFWEKRLRFNLHSLNSHGFACLKHQDSDLIHPLKANCMKLKRPHPRFQRAPQGDNVNVFWEVFKSSSFALGILLFFIGWVYLAYYFKYFGLSIYEINTEIFTYYLYGFYIVQKPLMASVLLLYLAAILILYYLKHKVSRFYLAMTLVVVSLFPVTFFIAQFYAKRKVISILTWKEQTPPITFSFKEDFIKHHFRKDSAMPVTAYRRMDSINTARLLRTSVQLQLRKLYETEDTYFVFYNPNGTDTLSMDVQVFQISKKDVDFSYSSINYSKLQNYKK